jgi:hypothetical protein
LLRLRKQVAKQQHGLRRLGQNPFISRQFGQALGVAATIGIAEPIAPRVGVRLPGRGEQSFLASEGRDTDPIVQGSYQPVADRGGSKALGRVRGVERLDIQAIAAECLPISRVCRLCVEVVVLYDGAFQADLFEAGDQVQVGPPLPHALPNPCIGHTGGQQPLGALHGRHGFGQLVAPVGSLRLI